ncbi:MAG: hypothetical protein KDJ29_21255 [Hyphomicrobiales bacterium]|nr:hypothetical protein [Hyphomicrobiales bacterium]
MADFYPLLSRAVANLPDATSERRHAIYDRARTALLGQLRSVEPSPEQAVIDSELASLDEAIQRVESELATAQVTETKTVTPIVPPPPSAPRPAGAIIKPPPSRVTPPPPRPMPPASRAPDSFKAPAPADPAAAVAAPADTSQPNASTAADAVPGATGLSSSASGETPPVETPTAAAETAPAAEPDASASPTATEPKAPVMSPPPAAAQPETPSQAPKLSAPAPGSTYPTHAAPSPSAAPPTPPVMAEPDVAMKAERPSSQVLQPAKRARKKGGLLAASAVLFVVVAAGAGYYSWKERLLPERFTRGFAVGTSSQSKAPATAASQNKSGDDKIASRAQPDENSAAKPQTPATDVEKQQSAPTGANDNASANNNTSTSDNPNASQPASAAKPDTKAGTSAEQGIAVAQRAALLVQQPAKDGKSEVKNYAGSVVWTTQNISRGSGQPLSFSVRAEITIPEAKFHATMTMEKNTDTTLPASHMITWRFKREEGSPIPAISEISVLQMHDDNSQVADPLNGAQAKITPDIYIYALAAPETLQSVNMETLQKRNWFLLPLKLSDNREARISIEKGTPGARAFAEAFQKWGVKLSEKNP